MAKYSKKHERLHNFFYSPGDEVIRVNALNTVESEITGIDYSKPLIVEKVEEITIQGEEFQLLYFVGNSSFHSSNDFYPHGVTLEQFRNTAEPPYKKKEDVVADTSSKVTTFTLKHNKVK